MMTYCQAIDTMSGAHQALHAHYHNTQYGFPIEDDNELFCRLVLEINQAGLSWTTILVKQDNFRKAYHQFNIKKVATYKDADVERLMADAGIIRNRLKVHAAIHNAQVILQLQKSHGSFKNWLYAQHPLNKEAWTKLFKKTFKFTGGEIVNEFLMSIGVLEGAHHPSCSVHQKTIKAKALWSHKQKK